MQLNKELASLADRTFDNFNINRKYIPMASANPETQKKMVNIALNRSIRFANKPEGWLYIHGLPGSGKSHIAAAIANKIGAYQNCVYRSMPALTDTLRDQVRNGPMETIIAALADVDVLILDDIGADGTPTEWIEARLFRILNDRVGKPTVFTANMDVQELPYHDRILDRLSAASKCWIAASSFRRLQGELGANRGISE